MCVDLSAQTGFYDPVASGAKISSVWMNAVEDAIGSGPAAQGSSYVVLKDGDTFKAKNGADGTILDSSSTDPKAVIQSAIDAAALAGGGLVFLKAATYTPMTGYISFQQKQNVALVGEGYSTVLDYSDNLGSGVLYAFMCYKNVENITLANFRLVGGNDAAYYPKIGLLWNGHPSYLTGGLRVVNVWFEDFLNTSGTILAQNTDGPIRISHNTFANVYLPLAVIDLTKNLWFTDNFMDGYTANGVDVQPNTDTAVENINVNRNTFISNASTYDKIAINLFMHLSGNQKNMEACDNIIYCNSKGSGILVTRGKNIRIAGNTIYKADQANAWGIKLRGCQHATVMGNTISDSTYGIKEEDYGTDYSDYNAIIGNICGDGNTTPYEFLVPCTNVLDGRVESDPVDLSGAADVKFLLHTETPLWLAQATLLYTEASSSDAGVALKIGKETDDDYYYTGTSETDKAQFYTLPVTLLAHDIAAGDTVTFSSAGSKSGGGEVQLILDFVGGA